MRYVIIFFLSAFIVYPTYAQDAPANILLPFECNRDSVPEEERWPATLPMPGHMLEIMGISIPDGQGGTRDVSEIAVVNFSVYEDGRVMLNEQDLSDKLSIKCTDRNNERLGESGAGAVKGPAVKETVEEASEKSASSAVEKEEAPQAVEEVETQEQVEEKSEEEPKKSLFDMFKF